MIREGIIRALTVKDGGVLVEDGLFHQFQIENDKDIKWVLENALKSAMPYNKRKKRTEIELNYKGK